MRSGKTSGKDIRLCNNGCYLVQRSIYPSSDQALRLHFICDSHPDIFLITSGSFHGVWTRVAWTDEALRYQQSNRHISGSDPERVPLETDIRLRPRPAAWKTFWARVEDTQVWTQAARVTGDLDLSGEAAAAAPEGFGVSSAFLTDGVPTGLA